MNGTQSKLKMPNLSGWLTISNAVCWLLFFSVLPNFIRMPWSLEYLIFCFMFLMSLPFGLFFVDAIGRPYNEEALVFGIIALGFNSVCWGYGLGWLLRTLSPRFSIRFLLVTTALIAVALAIMAHLTKNSF